MSFEVEWFVGRWISYNTGYATAKEAFADLRYWREQHDEDFRVVKVVTIREVVDDDD